ncbi:hypothetical protein [Geodermatophilus sp. SYSU D00684]
MIIVMSLLSRWWRIRQRVRTVLGGAPTRGALANARRAVERDLEAAAQREEAERAVARAVARAAEHPSALPRPVRSR